MSQLTRVVRVGAGGHGAAEAASLDCGDSIHAGQWSIIVPHSPHRRVTVFDSHQEPGPELDGGIAPELGEPEGSGGLHLAPDPPRDATGAPILRDRPALRSLLRREAEWVCARLPRALVPEHDDDPRWVTDPDLDGAITAAWADPAERGVLLVWPGELEQLQVEDVPHGAGLSVDAGPDDDLDDVFDGVLRRGVGTWPLAVEVELGAMRLGWERTLDVTAYTSLIHAAAEIRAADAGDLDIGYDDRGATGPFGVTLRVRVRCRTTSTSEAFRAAQEYRGCLARAS